MAATDEADYEGGISEHNIRGQLKLLLSQMTCWKCTLPMCVGAFAAIAGTKVWVDDALPPRWLSMDDGAELSRVDAVSDRIAQSVRILLPTFRPAFSRTVESTYWMNHCSHCGVGTGDFYTQSPDGPFFAWPRSQREGIEVIDLGDGSLSAEPPYLIPPEFQARRRTRA